MQLMSQSISPARSNGQSTITQRVHRPSLICHFDAVTSARNFLCGQLTVCMRSVQGAANFLRAEVPGIIHLVVHGPSELTRGFRAA